GIVDRMIKNANTKLMLGTSSWREQFIDALTKFRTNLEFLALLDGDLTLGIFTKARFSQLGDLQLVSRQPSHSVVRTYNL
ncbi:hypothetical protein ANCDUO_21717, partial [Ancylostoma duodenale]